nr:hypothetical protein CFP56_57978 [Quercus suber]
MNPEQPDLTIIADPPISNVKPLHQQTHSLPSKPNIAREFSSFGLIGRLIASKANNKVRGLELFSSRLGKSNIAEVLILGIG